MATMTSKWVAQLAARAALTAKQSSSLLPASSLKTSEGCLKTWTRLLNVHEYQGAKHMAGFGVNVPPGIVAFSVPEAVEAAKEMDGGSGEVSRRARAKNGRGSAQRGPRSLDPRVKGEEEEELRELTPFSLSLSLARFAPQVVVKSQILAGGRGLGTFKNGLQGGVHICKTEEVEGLAKQMVGEILVTKQTGPEGKPVNCLYVAKKMELKNEKYFAILLDRGSGGPLVIACSEGGTSIEDLAEKFPDKIIKVPTDINAGITDDQVAQIVAGLEVSGDQAAAADQVRGLYNLFLDSDCTMVEVNPLAEDPEGNLIAADAKLGFDDNASFRQKELFALKDDSQIDPREVAASKWDLNYIGLDGKIGCMVNGAGLAMATMDIIKLHGGKPPLPPSCLFGRVPCIGTSLTRTLARSRAPCPLFVSPRLVFSVLRHPRELPRRRGLRREAADRRGLQDPHHGRPRQGHPRQHLRRHHEVRRHRRGNRRGRERARLEGSPGGEAGGNERGDGEEDHGGQRHDHHHSGRPGRCSKEGGRIHEGLGLGPSPINPTILSVQKHIPT